MRLRTVRLFSLATAIGLLALVGFLGVQVRPAFAASPSFVRVIHASPYVGTADVFVDGAKLLSSFAFGAITDYVSIPAGPHKVQIALVGRGVGAAVIVQTLSVTPGLAYTVAAIGSLPTNLSLKVFVDNNILSPGSAKFRMYQLSPDAGSVTVALGAKNLLNGIGYQEASNYLVIAAGGYTFDVSSPTNNAKLSTSATLAANIVASLFVVGMFNGTPKSELVTSQTAGLPNVPNSGSDPTAVPQGTAAHPLIPWSWLPGITLLLLVGSGVFIRRIIAKRGASSR